MPASARRASISALDGGFLDVVQLRETGIDIFVSPVGDGALVRLFAIPFVNLLDHTHAISQHHAERRKALAVEPLIAAQVDEKLRGARVRTGRGVDDGTDPIGLRDWIVRDGRIPFPGDGGVGGQAELHHEIRDYAKEARAIEKAGFHQRIEMVGADWRPIPMYLNVDRALAGIEADLIRCGRLAGCLAWYRLRRFRRLDGCRGSLFFGRLGLLAGLRAADQKQCLEDNRADDTGLELAMGHSSGSILTGYSCRRAVRGSTLAARREGIQEARKATAARNRGTAVKVTTSCG